MTWTDTKPLAAHYLGIATGADSQGEFHFCDLGKLKPDVAQLSVNKA